MVKMDFQTHQSIEKWTENISFRHINIPCPVTYRSFSHLKLTVKWVWHRRPPRARARQTWRAERGGSHPPTSPGFWASAAAYLQDQVKGGPPTSLSRTLSVSWGVQTMKWPKKSNRSEMAVTQYSTPVDFSNFNDFFVKILKIHNFVNNRPIFTGLVLNDVEYEYLQLFFCIKVEFMKNKASLEGTPSDFPGWRQLARRSPDHSARVRYLENFKVRMKT